jgi:hypothetical protein
LLKILFVDNFIIWIEDIVRQFEEVSVDRAGATVGLGTEIPELVLVLIGVSEKLPPRLLLARKMMCLVPNCVDYFAGYFALGRYFESLCLAYSMKLLSVQHCLKD